MIAGQSTCTIHSGSAGALGVSGEPFSPARTSRISRREHPSARAISRTPRPSATRRAISAYRSTVNFLRAMLALPFVLAHDGTGQGGSAPVGPIRGNRVGPISGNQVGPIPGNRVGSIRGNSALTVPPMRLARRLEAAPYPAGVGKENTDCLQRVTGLLTARPPKPA